MMVWSCGIFLHRKAFQAHPPVNVNRAVVKPVIASPT